MKKLGPIVAPIAKDTYVINEYGFSSMFLLVGSARALLIDTGSGITDIKPLIASLTDKPYDVVITHNDGDHIFGSPQFEEIWIHPNDIPGTFPLNWSFIANLIDNMKAYAFCSLFDIDESWMHKLSSEPKMNALHEGQVFDLGGGREIEVIEMFGHTPGQCVFLDRLGRKLFSGDACNTNLVLNIHDVPTALQGLEKLKTREPEFDENWNGHPGFIDDMRLRCVPRRALDDCITICKMLIDGTAALEPFDWAITAGQDVGQLQRACHGSAQVCLLPDKMRRNRN